MSTGQERLTLSHPEEELQAAELAWAEHHLPIFAAQASFHEFVRQAWPVVQGSVPFIDGWHIGALCEHLEAAYRREIRKLLINLPPRCAKSTVVSVMFQAWVWIHEPSEKFLTSSYSASLSNRDTVKCRRLIQSKWYRERWGHLYNLAKDQNTKTRFDNDKGGYRIATSTNGSSTGEGGTFRMWDDANNAKHGESKTQRDSTNAWLSSVWWSRKEDPKRDVDIGTAQRLNMNDASGYWMRNDEDGELVKLILPMEFETKRQCKTIVLPSSFGKVWIDPRKREGELLWPERMGPKEVAQSKKELATSYRIAGQLQQRPAPEKGGMIKSDWFRMWKHPRPPTNITQVVQSWDTALEAHEMGAYSACTTWGLFEDEKTGLNNLLLLGLWRGRVEYPELRKMAIRLYDDYRDDGQVKITPDDKHVPDVVIIEAKASGHSLVHDLTRAGITAVRFNPTKYGDKIQRVQLATYMIEAGRIWIPASPPDFIYPRAFGNTLIQLCSIFPADDARDVVDTMTQVILRLRDSGYLSHVTDDHETQSTKPNHGFYEANAEIGE